MVLLCRPQVRKNAQEVRKIRFQNQSLTERLESEKNEKKEIKEMLSRSLKRRIIAC